MMLRLDLPPKPGERVLPGLTHEGGFITVDEKHALIGEIGGAGLTPFLFQQWTGKRLTKSFGWSYDFWTGKFGEAEPFISTLELMADHRAVLCT